MGLALLALRLLAPSFFVAAITGISGFAVAQTCFPVNEKGVGCITAEPVTKNDTYAGIQQIQSFSNICEFQVTVRVELYIENEKGVDGVDHTTAFVPAHGRASAECLQGTGCRGFGVHSFPNCEHSGTRENHPSSNRPASPKTELKHGEDPGGILVNPNPKGDTNDLTDIRNKTLHPPTN
jgi:hypothetical protein